MRPLQVSSLSFSDEVTDWTTGTGGHYSRGSQRVLGARARARVPPRHTHGRDELATELHQTRWEGGQGPPSQTG